MLKTVLPARLRPTITKLNNNINATTRTIVTLQITILITRNTKKLYHHHHYHCHHRDLVAEENGNFLSYTAELGRDYHHYLIRRKKALLLLQAGVAKEWARRYLRIKPFPNHLLLLLLRATRIPWQQLQQPLRIHCIIQKKKKKKAIHHHHQQERKRETRIL